MELVLLLRLTELLKMQATAPRIAILLVVTDFAQQVLQLVTVLKAHLIVPRIVVLQFVVIGFVLSTLLMGRQKVLLAAPKTVLVAMAIATSSLSHVFGATTAVVRKAIIFQ